VPLLIVPVLVILAVIALIPVSLVQRYRMATSRQRARGWLVAINLAGLLLSAVLFLASAAVTSVWVPNALAYTAAGLAAGCLLGIVGLGLTRWEPTPGSLHYTPNRLLVLGLTLVVTARLLYGFWRGAHAWRAGMLSDSGLAGSMAAGAVVLGYYLAYWFGVRRRFRRIGR
jgi:glucose-6-phosphate-specific signal transduction histidine kinase